MKKIIYIFAFIAITFTSCNSDYSYQSSSKFDLNNPYYPILIDLKDNLNQRIQNGGNTNYPNDNVTGYTLPQIEVALKSAQTLDDFISNIKTMYDNPTENNIDELINFYKAI